MAAEMLAERARLGRKLTHPERMTISRTRIDEYFDAAPDEEIAMVNAELDREKQARLVPPPPAATDNVTRTPQEYQK